MTKIVTKDDIDKFAKAIAENVCRKQMSWQEEVLAKEQLDQLMREKYGNKDRYSHPKATSQNEDGWSYRRTSEILNEAEGKTRQDIQLARAIKEYPEIARYEIKTTIIYC